MTAEKTVRPEVDHGRMQPPLARVVRGASLAAILFAAFVALAAARHTQAISGFDSALIAAIHAWRSPGLTSWFVRGTDIGAFVVTGPVSAIVLAILLARRMWRAAGFVLAVYAIGYYLGTVAQGIVARGRPPQVDALIELPNAYSFPSGHSISAMLLYGAIAFLVWRSSLRLWAKCPLLIGCVAVIVFVGLSRVYLGVHWPSDVVGAWLLGSAWLALVAGAYLAWDARSADSRPNPDRPQ